MHNVFEMGFDLLAKDPGILERIQEAQKHYGEIDPDYASAFSQYMS